MNEIKATGRPGEPAQRRRALAKLTGGLPIDPASGAILA